MIGRLSAIIMACKEFVYRHAALRYLCYLAIVISLLLFWLCTDVPEISFVYNAF